MNKHLKSVLRPGFILLKSVFGPPLHKLKYGSALAMRRSIPFLDKTAPALGRKIRTWGWIWQPVYSAGWLKKFYKKSADPYHFDNNPYEAEKYAHTMRLLNGRIYEKALEIGGAEGIFTQMLAPICTSLLAVEVAEAAVERANERLRDNTNVTFIQATLPHQMPNGQFDLIIASDVLYYFPKDVVLDLLTRFEEGLKPDGILFTLHYLGNFDQAMVGRELHDLMKRHLKLEQTHDETVAGVGPGGSGYTITIFRKPAANA
jgi:protein-L-isoaspartate O-methyltransferase